MQEVERTQAPALCGFTVITSLIYNIITCPSMKSVFFPTLKLSAVGFLGVFAYYRYQRMQNNYKVEEYFNKIVSRKQA